MFKINENYLKLPGSYLFSTIGKKVAAYQEKNPDRKIIRLGIGDVTQPLAPAVIEALHNAVDEMGDSATFHGYAPDLGYEFLRKAIAVNDYAQRGCDIQPDEIFVSDGAKCDSGNIQEIFSIDNKIAVCDPVYPVYVDTNVMAGRTGTYDSVKEMWSDVIYMPCTQENGFVPELPEAAPDIIYLCFPNNPTGSTITKSGLQAWVDYANRTGAVIIYDAAYEAYISEKDVPHSIYECEGARTCAIELRSFSKNAGFTGVRLGFTVVPRDLKAGDVPLHDLWARRHGTKYNGAPYIVQRAGEAVYSDAGKTQLKEQVAYYMKNAKIILEGLKKAGYSVSGGVNAPYIWLKTPGSMTSWEFFDHLLFKAGVVGTPGAGFGPSGEGYFRLTAFGSHENTIEAIERIKKLG
ncbi:LL-diaminopimelate aminotransferase [Murimonas intestini]|uniref:LL-diaminopimelate aminotransferase n=1 Tax=Murimonas intestini TaxID=1337051 RepID=A0AB73SXE1_9FIRM|nr:LL-diaminopimelate aminotransferase [Murimonas intestini]MCR1843458.1 LL-diaminopimelate aminotransferase [Murimonas intestini]MCR1868788.1 LL-diaminopimelate aminotransferase [Murimonas intestini]MCR1886252.1 LL-diaminopimelate aminotransferase [Murimonas intestini]